MRLPVRMRLAEWLLIVTACIALTVGCGLLRIARSAGGRLDALVVTPAPLPIGTPTAVAPNLVLPTLAAEVPITPTAEANAPITVLLLGSDRRPGETAIPRTDAMIVLRIDPQQQRVALLSLPRDLWVAIPGHQPNRISNAYLWGERDGPPGAGMTLAAATVAQLLDLPIDYTVLIDLEGFRTLVDTIGGVDVDVARELVDTRYPTNDYGVTTVRFAPGRQRMYGDAALAYARMRHPDSDFERAQRQQQVLLAIAERLRERGHLANLLAAEQMSLALADLLITDMPRDRMLSLVWALRDLPLSALERLALREEDVIFGVDADRYAQIPRPGVIAALSADLRGDR